MRKRASELRLSVTAVDEAGAAEAPALVAAVAEAASAEVMVAAAVVAAAAMVVAAVVVAAAAVVVASVVAPVLPLDEGGPWLLLRQSCRRQMEKSCCWR